MKKIFFLSVIVALSVSLCLKNNLAYSNDYKPAVIRIAVIKDADSVTLAIRGKYKILSLYTRELLSEGRKLRKVKVAPTVSGLLIGETPFKIFAIRIEPARDASIFINNRRFRGSIDLVRTEDLKLLIVNHINVESYLYGVLYHEVSPRWTMPALEAQAIIARTFALYQARVRKKEDYDLTSDVYSQVYGGRTSEKWRTNRAVNLTRGKVLTFKGDIFPTYYHATCAGHTEDASRLWNTNLKPLKGVKCDYCRKAPHYKWRRKISLGKIEERLRKNGYNVKGILSIEVEGRNETGRVTNLIIKGKGSKAKIHSNKFRLIIGPNIIRSANLDVTLNRGAAYFEGLGWGHGVGLCQWGSYLMSKRNPKQKVEEVLKFYYPGSKIKNIKELGYAVERF